MKLSSLKKTASFSSASFHWEIGQQESHPWWIHHDQVRRWPYPMTRTQRNDRRTRQTGESFLSQKHPRMSKGHMWERKPTDRRGRQERGAAKNGIIAAKSNGIKKG